MNLGNTSVSNFRSSNSGAESGAGRAAFTAPPGSAAVVVAVAVDPTGMRQLPVSEGALSSEPQRLLTRKRPVEVEQTVALPSAKKPADRTVQIADFTWTLPPDPGEGGSYPSLAFLIGAAISSSERGGMKLTDICQWVRARYPSWSGSVGCSIARTLSQSADFTNIGTIKKGVGLWTLCNPQKFGHYYENNIFLKRQPESSLSGQPARPGTEGDTHLTPALPVKIGDYILTLPPWAADQCRPPLKLLCGCAVALGPERGSSTTEITEWIAGRYCIRGQSTISGLQANVRKVLRGYKNHFQRMDTHELVRPTRGRPGLKWILKNPSAFAAGYPSVLAAGCKERSYRQSHLSVVSEQQGTEQPLSATGQGYTVSPDSRGGAVARPADMRQVAASESALSSEPQRLLTRKRPVEVEQTVALPSAKKPADRTVQIADFTWTLPPDPGEGGSYPSITFLIGAAISSSESGMMTRGEILQWIRARYPSEPASLCGAVSSVLSSRADFIGIKDDIHASKGVWTLRNSRQFRRFYEKDIFKGRFGIALDKVYSDARSAAGREGTEAASPAPESPLFAPEPVTIGGRVLTLPPCASGRQRPPLRLLCGCAIALGSEQRAGANEITEWIAGRYPVQGEGAMRVLRASISRALRKHKNDFLQTDICELVRWSRGRVGVKWVLKNPSAFAAGCKGGLYRWGLLSVAAQQQDTDQPLSATDQDSSVGNSQNR